MQYNIITQLYNMHSLVYCLISYYYVIVTAIGDVILHIT